jgi:hypothetical protein
MGVERLHPWWAFCVNMSWLKQNWFKLVIAVAALLLSFSAVYYFVFALPTYHAQLVSQQNSNSLAQNQENCADAANTVQQLYVAGGYEASNSDALDVQNHYDASMRTCFVEINDQYCGGTTGC